MRTPDFWSGRGATSVLLLPAAAVYAWATRRRVARAPDYEPPVPVVCVGNLSAGGSGKTPVAMSVAAILANKGIAAHLLTRGYRGRLPGPVRVDPARHTAADVGDEPLLLARAAPTWVARDRAAGARAAVEAGARAIVMDDGHQNPALRKDLSLVVVDGGFGFGNRRVIPAGPLREPIAAGLARADAVVMVGGDAAEAGERLGDTPRLDARLAPSEEALALRGRKVVAFAGIGRPDKFFDTLTSLGAQLVEALPFADHHRFSEQDVMLICEIASSREAVPVTTEKDYVRLSPDARLMVTPVPVLLEWENPAEIVALLDRTLAGFGGRDA